ncbi:MAG: DNA-3-methyladenine glycosylase 2 family protein [Rubrivivax sp.]|nr:DNA-3-methyladenine glycosylase 2 family protein [Rubrivivax sp.]
MPHTRPSRLQPRDGTAQALYAAVKARDARFDGRFFVGVTSTGIYCRPVCRVRTPLMRNCRFFGNAASAERAGFRPCLRCRPELAPGLSFVDSSRALAQAAARSLTQAVLEGRDVHLPDVAARLGVTDRHLRRIFAAEHGVSPLDFVTTQRLLHAKQLLTDTAMPVTQVALVSGFASVRRFNAAFAERYRLSPSALRRERPPADAAAAQAATPDTAADAEASETRAAARTAARASAKVAARAASPSNVPTVRLGYRPPYDAPGVLRFLARRALPGVEAVDEAEGRVAATMGWAHGGKRLAGWWSARFLPERHEVEVQVAESLLPVLGLVLQRLRQGLDLDADPALIDPVLAAVPGPAVPGLRVPGALCGFDAAVRVVLGQQVTVAAARTLTTRLVLAFGAPVATPVPGLTQLFPTAAALAHAEADAIGRLGIVRQRVRALQALATEVAAGRLRLEATAPLAETLAQLRELPGFGEWTVQLVALRALGWPDAFPATDIGVLDALAPLHGGRDAKAAEQASQAWRPWRGYAVMKLWRSLELTP